MIDIFDFFWHPVTLKKKVHCYQIIDFQIELTYEHVNTISSADHDYFAFRLSVTLDVIKLMGSLFGRVNDIRSTPVLRFFENSFMAIRFTIN